MQRHALAGILLCFATSIAACGSSGESSSGPGPSGTGGSGGASTSTGTGGDGGSVTSSGTGGSSTGGTMSTGGTGGSGGMAAPPDHLVISELGTAPAGGEFIELYNPTNAAVDLSNYYLSDNSVYHGIASGQAWTPMGTAGTDFLAQFPAGTMLAPGAALVIASDAAFETVFSKCPDFILSDTPLTCTNGTAAAMIVPTNGGIGDQAGSMLSNEREMVILFQWDGAAATVKDVDYVTWGTMFDDATRVDKTEIGRAHV